MDQYRVIFRPELSIPDRIVEAECVTWPGDDWEPIYFWSDARATELVAMIRYDFIGQILNVTPAPVTS